MGKWRICHKTAQRQQFANHQFDQLYRLDIEQREACHASSDETNEQRIR
jgi:hypothetical protein